MNEDQFNELLNSVQEAGKIMRGEFKASRELKFEFDEPDVMPTFIISKTKIFVYYSMAYYL